MPKKSKKSVSKRMSSKDKFKIVRKVKEHNRKKRKELKKKGGRSKPSVLKDPGIPNQYPFREQIVKEFKFEKDRIAARDAAKKDARRARRLALQEGAPDDVELEGGDDGDEEMTLDTAAQLAAVSAAAAAAQQQHADRAASSAHATPSGTFQDGSRKAFYKEFKKVVELSDVIIQVLDARDPLATRCGDVERYIRSVGVGKKIVLVLNKIDLVPREVAEAWLKYFRQELPTVAFKAATKRSGTIAHARMPGAQGAATPATAECLGADSLLQLLKNYVHATGAKVAVTVGVIGPPNVGKSSIINSLKRSKVAAVGNTPGVTTGVQEVHLDKHLRLVDSPGVVFSAAADAAEAALRNCIKVEKIEDPVGAVAAIVRRVPAKCLMHVYTAGTFTSADALLTHIATARGKLRKGGLPDLPAAARLVIQDWNDGRIPYYTRPPSRGNEGHEAAALVATMAAEFDADKVYAAEASTVIAGLQDDAALAYAEARPGAAGTVDFAALETEAGADAAAASGDSDMDDNEVPQQQAGAAAAAQAPQPARDAVLYSAQGQHNPKAARAAKRAARKKKAAGDEAFDFGVLDDGEGMAE